MISIAKPTLMVVTGQPGSGKTTLAHRLARAVRCPVISRDEIKEGLINSIAPRGQPCDDIARQAYETFFETVTLLLNRRVTLIAEAAFQHKLWAPSLEPLRKIAQTRIIVCIIDSALAQTRRIERDASDPQRKRFHDQAPQLAAYDPPHLDVPTLTVDTTDTYRPDFAAIVAFAQV
jgi:predicted kinase